MRKVKECILHYPFLFVGVVVFFAHCLLHPFGDDIWWSNEIIADGYLKYFYFRYIGWTSRILSEFLVNWFTKWPFICWQIADSLIITILIRNMYRIIFSDDNRYLPMYLFVVSLFPLWEISNAGWISTTIVYIWPYISFSYVFLIVKDCCHGKKIKNYQWFLYVVSILHSVNFEHTTIFLVVLPVYLILENIVMHKRNDHLLYLTLFSGIIGIVYTVTCPGNIQRFRVSEIPNWFPTFPMLSFQDKIMIGVSDTIFHLISTPSLLYLFLLFCIFLYVHFHYNDIVYDTVNFLPLFICSVAFALPIFHNGIIGMSGYYILNAESFHNLGSLLLYVAINWWLLLWPLLGLSLIFKNQLFFRVVAIYVTGFGIRVLMGFSPTVYVSGSRTFLPVYLSILIILILIFKECNSRREE